MYHKTVRNTDATEQIKRIAGYKLLQGTNRLLRNVFPCAVPIDTLIVYMTLATPPWVGTETAWAATLVVGSGTIVGSPFKAKSGHTPLPGEKATELIVIMLSPGSFINS